VTVSLLATPVASIAISSGFRQRAVLKWLAPEITLIYAAGIYLRPLIWDMPGAKIPKAEAMDFVWLALASVDQITEFSVARSDRLAETFSRPHRRSSGCIA
jgi:hypothetical protein